MFVDSHCHLDRLKLDSYEGDVSLAIAAAKDAGVQKMLCVAIDLENVDQVISIAEKHENVFASVGVHPTSFEGEAPTYDRLIELADHPKVVAIGESGLDYYYSVDKKEEQQSRFITHLKVAEATKKPIIVHTRDAREDTISILKEHSDDSVAGVLHCFTENWEMAKKAIDLNFFISFSGIVTFKNATELKDVAKKVPLDRMLIETDSPYLAPVPFRGKSNEPKYVPHVAEHIAELRGLEPEEIARITTDNFHNLFKHTDGRV